MSFKYLDSLTALTEKAMHPYCMDGQTKTSSLSKFHCKAHGVFHQESDGTPDEKPKGITRHLPIEVRVSIMLLDPFVLFVCIIHRAYMCFNTCVALYTFDTLYSLLCVLECILCIRCIRIFRTGQPKTPDPVRAHEWMGSKAVC